MRAGAASRPASMTGRCSCWAGAEFVDSLCEVANVRERNEAGPKMPCRTVDAVQVLGSIKSSAEWKFGSLRSWPAPSKSNFDARNHESVDGDNHFDLVYPGLTTHRGQQLEELLHPNGESFPSPNILSSSLRSKTGRAIATGHAIPTDATL